MKGFKKAWGKGGKGAAAIFNNVVHGNELPDSQKQGLRDFRDAINGTPAPFQQELEAQRQATQQAEIARAEAQAEQQAAEQRAAIARTEQEAANAETAKLQAEAAQLQAQLDAANARTAAAQEAQKVAELKAQLAQLKAQPEVARAESAASLRKKEAPADSESSAAAGATTPPPSPNAQQDSEAVRELDLNERLVELSKEISSINALPNPDDRERAKEQVRIKVKEYNLSPEDFALLEKLVIESSALISIMPADMDAFLNELEGMTIASDNVPLAGGAVELDLTS